MLDALRKGAKTWLAKVLIGLLVISFAIWGISDIFRAPGGDEVARVGDTPILSRDFQLLYMDRMQAHSQQTGQPLNYQQAAAMGLPQQVLGTLASQAALSDTAKLMGLGVSDSRLAVQITEDPALQSGTGEFDRAYLQRVLQARGLSENEYVTERRHASLRGQIVEGIMGNVAIPDTLAEAVEQYRNARRVVSYVALLPEEAEAIDGPGEDELEAYFRDNRDQFRAPEYRGLDLLSLTPEAIAATLSVSEEDARAEYEQNRHFYEEPERRRVRQLLFASQEAADAAATRLADGAGFDDIADDPDIAGNVSNLGLVTAEDIIDPAIGEVAFGLDEGETSGIVEARFGSAIVEVAEIEGAGSAPFESVREEIETDLARRLASQDIYGLYNEVEDGLAGGATLQEIAGLLNLSVRSLEGVARDGTSIDGAPVGDIPASAEVLQGAFETDIAVENAPVSHDGGYVWYEVTDITEARERELDEVRDDVEERWRAEQRDRRLREAAAAVVERVEGGESLEAVAEELGLDVVRSEPLRRNDRLDDLGETGVRAAFGGPEGHVATTRRDDGARIVLVVEEVRPAAYFAAEQETATISAQLSESLQNALLSLYISHIQNTRGTSVNQSALQQAIGLGNTTQN